MASSPSRPQIEDDALRSLIQDYTREAGVRGLEREIGRALRHAAVEIAEGKNAECTHRSCGSASMSWDLRASTMKSRCARACRALRQALRGPPSAATSCSSKPLGRRAAATLTLTGQLGEVMRESAQAAMTLVKSRAASLGIASETFEKSDVHIHVPAGATPKDGPSAGVAIYTALVSLFTDRTVRNDTAMTGEISLRGLVLPVGGIKEKVTAAARAGLKRVMLPARNRRDYDDIPEDARAKLEFIWLNQVDDAIAAGLENGPPSAA